MLWISFICFSVLLIIMVDIRGFEVDYPIPLRPRHLKRVMRDIISLEVHEDLWSYVRGDDMIKAGHSEKDVDKYMTLVWALNQKPGTQIQIVESLDFLCLNCDKRTEECEKQDERFYFLAYNLKVGEIIRLMDTYSRRKLDNSKIAIKRAV